jgi:uncharacterized protein (DUF1330 family)
VKTLEGEGQAPSVVMVVESPALAEAHAWDHDPRDASLMKVCQTGAAMDIVIGAGAGVSPMSPHHKRGGR